jgi:hypothetical protein
MTEEEKTFCIKIIDREALLVFYALGRTVRINALSLLS